MNYLNKSEYPLFFLGFCLKIVFGLFFASHFLTDLFIPFVDYFIKSGFSDPYSHFLNEGVKEAFPYPALMLMILALPNIIFGWVTDNPAFTLFLYRLPLLICDLTIFIILRSWLTESARHYLLWLYWLSPVMIYISFIQGQLDVIPISFLIVSLHFLFKGDLAKSAILLGLCLATKTMTVIIFPFLVLYLLSQKYNFSKIIYFGVMTSLFFILPNIFFLSSEAFYLMVFANQQQDKIFDALMTLGSSSIFLIPVAYLLLLFRGFTIRTFNRDIFIMFLGFAFGIILIFIPPMPGWYYWLLPFLFYFYSKAQSRSFYLVVILQISYLSYFGITNNSEFFISLNLETERISNLIFSLLQGFLILNCFWIYQFGLTSYLKYKISSVPFLVGIGGNSGAGKSTVARALEEVFQKRKVTLINGDDIHRWERGNNKWSKFTHFDPKANHLHNEIGMLKDLKRGLSILRRKYDHSKGDFGEEKQLKPSNLILYEGLHPFYLKRLRELFDLNIFLKPSDKLRFSWKVNRDTRLRGKTKEEVLEQISSREKDSVSYVEIQSEHADVIIEPFLESDSEDHNSIVCFKIILPNSISFDPILEEIEKIKTLKLEHNYQKMDTQELTVSGFVSSQEISKIASRSIEGLKEIGITEPNWPDNPFGVVIMVITFLIFEEALYEKTASH